MPEWLRQYQQFLVADDCGARSHGILAYDTQRSVRLKNDGAHQSNVPKATGSNSLHDLRLGYSTGANRAVEDLPV